MNKTTTFKSIASDISLYSIAHTHLHIHKHKSIIQNAFQPEFLLFKAITKT